MRVMRTAIVMGTLLCSLSWAQSSTPAPDQAQPSQVQPNQAPTPQSQPANATRIAPGTVIPVQLTKSIDAKKAKTGEEVRAKVTQDLKTTSGEVVIPKDTEVVGHITEAQPRTKGEKESDLGITFDHATLKGGNDLSMPASIQAVIAPRPQNPNSAEGGTGAAAPSPNASGYGTGRSPNMSGEAQPSANSAPGGDDTNNTNTTSARPPITAQTQGVIGLSDYRLSTPTDAKQGSVVSSEKNNVKLESGTLMLLRVNP